MSSRTIAVFGLAMTLLAVSARAQDTAESTQPASIRTGIVIGKASKQLTLWTKNGREAFQFTADTVMPQRTLKDGHLVVVRETAPGSHVAERIIIVDEQVLVTAKAPRPREYAVIGTTGQGQSPAQLIIRTRDGKQAFVVDPKTFRQPLPGPDQRVALTYRIENVVPPLYKATGLVVLSPVLDDSPVKITYSDLPVEEPEPVIAEAAPLPEPEPEAVLAELPQTASRVPAALLAGLLLVTAGAALRRA